MSEDIALQEQFATRKLDKAILGRLYGFIRPYRKAFFGAMTMELLWVCSMLLGPYLVGIALDECIVKRNIRGLAIVAAVYVLNCIVRFCWVAIELRLTMFAGQRILNDMRMAVFRHIQSLSMRFFDTHKQGRIIARADRDIDTLEMPLVWGPLIFVSCVFCIIMVSIIMCCRDWQLFLSVCATAPIMVIATEVFRRRGTDAYRTLRESQSHVTAELAENISGVRVAQAFGREETNIGRFHGVSDKHNRSVIRVSIVWNSYFPVMNMTYAIATCALVIVGGMRMAQGDLSVGTLVSFILYLGALFGPIEGLSFIYNQSLAGAAAAERIIDVLDTKPEIVDVPNAIELGTIKGEVRFQNVDLAYENQNVDKSESEGEVDPPACNYVLHDITFVAEAGETIALVGPTGAGKSSILNLVARFYEPQRGIITLDAVNIGNIALHSLHSHMGIVLQENFLFSGTVMDNLRFGNPDVTEKEAIEAAKAMGSHDLLAKLPNGFDTEVKERGSGLSQGERQLICFTRALIANPSILILDEATSAVDSKTEKVLHDALEVLMKDRTCFIVAHRLSTIRNASRVLVIDEGRIIEEGTHIELLKRQGRYAKMYADYLRNE
ncbi:ABC transporter ATP-binding protein [Candidatus Hydrogenedentota bacterium]